MWGVWGGGKIFFLGGGGGGRGYQKDYFGNSIRCYHLVFWTPGAIAHKVGCGCQGSLSRHLGCEGWIERQGAPKNSVDSGGKGKGGEKG